MVVGQRHRSMEMIDGVCVVLEPLGDALAVVVNVQDATAKNGNEAETLSRNCQLPEGERAFMQAKRELGAVAPGVGSSSSGCSGGRNNCMYGKEHFGASF